MLINCWKHSCRVTKLLIPDSGADTSVLGENWSIQGIHGPTINLVGFDSNVSKKKNLRLCTADTILEHPQFGNVLLQIHQAVHNPDARNTLLSEYQLSEGGCLIDGEFGTQSFKLSSLEHVWKFDIEKLLFHIVLLQLRKSRQ